MAVPLAHQRLELVLNPAVVVYKARQKELHRVVALRNLPPGIGQDPAFAARFTRETKALDKPHHPGIVTIHDFGPANGLFCFLMEFVDGVSLRRLLEVERISPRAALDIVPQLCDALQYAHDQGIVHRDIKPEIILLDRRGRVKVAGFGFAKLVPLELAPESGQGLNRPSCLRRGRWFGHLACHAMSEVTRVLTALERGESQAAEQLLPLVYTKLRRLAAWHMAKEQPGQTLQATALVHEAWLRVSGGQNQHWDSRRHFFAAAAEAMRRILVDNARRKQAVRHGGGLRRTDLEEVDIVAGHPEEELLAVHEALDALAAHDARKADLVRLRYFAGLTLEEAAGALGLSVRTAKRDWAYARAWLFREIARQRA